MEGPGGSPFHLAGGGGAEVGERRELRGVERTWENIPGRSPINK